MNKIDIVGMENFSPKSRKRAKVSGKCVLNIRAETREYFVFEALAGVSPMVCREVCELKISSLNYSTFHNHVL
jgi:hypothetical protein